MNRVTPHLDPDDEALLADLSQLGPDLLAHYQQVQEANFRLQQTLDRLQKRSRLMDTTAIVMASMFVAGTVNRLSGGPEWVNVAFGLAFLVVTAVCVVLIGLAIRDHRTFKHELNALQPFPFP